jgi:hypothetical protein
MGAQPKRKRSTYAKGKRQAAIKRHFLKMVQKRISQLKKNENAA